MKYIISALFLFVVSIIAFRIYFRSPSPTPINTYRVKSEKGAIVRWTGASGKIYYRLIGSFLSNLDYQGEALVGQFVIDEDPKKVPIPVSIDIQKGTFGLVIFPNTFDDVVEGSDVSGAVLVEKIKKNVKTALYIVGKNDSLNFAINGSWSIDSQMTLQPIMLGLLGEK